MSGQHLEVSKRKRCRLGVALLALVVLGVPRVAGAAGFDQFIGLGDSTMDSGYFRYNPTGGYGPFTDAQANALIAWVVANGGSGAFAGPGVLDTTLLAAKFG